MLYTLHILALKPNQTRLLSLMERRNYFYHSFGLSSALAFEPVIPISVCAIQAERASAAPGETPFEKELFIDFSRSREGADAPPVLTFSPLERFWNTYYYPLTTSRVWETFTSMLEKEQKTGEPSISPVSSVQPIPPFPGIFVAAEEGAADGHGAAIVEGGLESSAPEFNETAPEPWRNYKLALFELQVQLDNNGKWWDSCSWYKVWELTLGGFS